MPVSILPAPIVTRKRSDSILVPSSSKTPIDVHALLAPRAKPPSRKLTRSPRFKSQENAKLSGTSLGSAGELTVDDIFTRPTSPRKSKVTGSRDTSGAVSTLPSTTTTKRLSPCKSMSVIVTRIQSVAEENVARAVAECRDLKEFFTSSKVKTQFLDLDGQYGGFNEVSAYVYLKMCALITVTEQPRTTSCSFGYLSEDAMTSEETIRPVECTVRGSPNKLATASHASDVFSDDGVCPRRSIWEPRSHHEVEDLTIASLGLDHSPSAITPPEPLHSVFEDNDDHLDFDLNLSLDHDPEAHFNLNLNLNLNFERPSFAWFLNETNDLDPDDIDGFLSMPLPPPPLPLHDMLNRDGVDDHRPPSRHGFFRDDSEEDDK
jgi:hypothetical protein